MNALGSTTAKAVSGDAGDAPAHAGVDFGSYEQALGELERIVLSMEAGQMPLDGLLEGYRRGAALLAHCRGRLEAVEEQVRLLEDGQLKPWSEVA